MTVKQLNILGRLSLTALLTAAPGALAAPIATVNSVAIDSSAILGELANLNELQKKRINKDPALRREILENAVNSELLFQAAKKDGLDKGDDFQRALEQFKRNFVITKFLEKNMASKLNASNAKSFFEKNKAQYDSTQVKAMHILVQSEADALKVLPEAKAAKTEKDFEILAKKYSIDPTVQDNSGNLGFFTRDRMVPEFSKTAFAMHKGETSSPVKSIFGYHIIRVTEVKFGKLPQFEEVESRVREDLKANLFRELVTGLRGQAKVQVEENAADKLKI